MNGSHSSSILVALPNRSPVLDIEGTRDILAATMPAKRRALLLLPWAWLGWAPECGAGPATSPEESAVRAFVLEFLQAFENLDMPRFIDCFADDATVFFPVPEPPSRVDGKAAIRARFEAVFAAIRRGAPDGPPYHRLVPEDLAVQAVGGESAVATFHLRNAQRIARRTLVLRRDGERWRIVHLHASNAAP